MATRQPLREALLRFLPSFRLHWLKLALLGIFVAFWCRAAWKPPHLDDWLLEKSPVIFRVPVLLETARFFSLSDIACWRR